jgi:carbonic anhydrase
MTHLHHSACSCLRGPLPHLSRRGLLGVALAGGAAAAFPAFAAGGSYEAMLVNCIDPRIATASWAYMAGHGYKDLYSHFVIAGGPIGVVSPKFADWHKAFWDNLAISIQLHAIKRVVGLTHRDCGAAVVAYGEEIKTNKAFETAKHTEALNEFRAEIGKRQPKLEVVTGIMALDGTVEPVA